MRINANFIYDYQQAICVAVSDENANLGTAMRYEEIGESLDRSRTLSSAFLSCCVWIPSGSFGSSKRDVYQVNMVLTDGWRRRLQSEPVVCWGPVCLFPPACLSVCVSVCRVTHLAPVWQWSPGVLLHPWPLEGQWCKHNVAPPLSCVAPPLSLFFLIRHFKKSKRSNASVSSIFLCTFLKCA